MSKVLLLTKVLLKSSFRGEKKEKVPTLLILALILIPCLGVPIYLGVEYLASFFPEFGINPISMLTLVFPISFLLIFVTSIFTIMSTYFLSNDIENLLPLPFKPWEIIIAKFLSSMIIIYIIIFSVLLPVLLGIGVGGHVDFIFFLYSIIIIIVFPIIPTSILSILITSLMRFSTKTKSKDKLTYIVSIISIIFSFGLSFGSNALVNNVMENTAATITTLQELIDHLGDAFMSIFFFLKPAYLALLNTSSPISILYILIFILTSIALILLFAYVGQKVYLKGIMGGKARKNKKEEKVEKTEIKKKSQFKTLVVRDIKTIWRSPSFNMNLLLMEILMPFIMIGAFSISFFNSDGDTSEILNFINNIDFRNPLTMGILLLVASFFASMTLASPTAFSREGKSASFLKGIPVSPITLIHSKMFFGTISSIIIYLVIFGIATIFGLLGIINFIFLTIAVIPYTILMNYIGIMIDIKHPKLVWDNETIPVKQNFNAMIFMFLFWIVGGIFTLIGYYIPFNGYIYLLIITLISVLGCLMFYSFIKKKGIDLFNKI